MMLLATDRLIFEPAASARTVVPLNRGTLVEMAVSESCLAVRADHVAYVELMLTSLTCSCVELSTPHVVCPVTESVRVSAQALEETTAATGRLEGAIASLRNEISVFRLG